MNKLVFNRPQRVKGHAKPLKGQTGICSGPEVGIWEVAEVDAEERLTADKSQGRFRHIIDL